MGHFMLFVGYVFRHVWLAPLVCWICVGSVFAKPKPGFRRLECQVLAVEDMFRDQLFLRKAEAFAGWLSLADGL